MNDCPHLFSRPSPKIGLKQQSALPLAGTEPKTPIIQTDYATSAMAILSHFGLGSIVDELLPTNGVHDIGNLLSLEINVHDRFDNLELWFEATDEVRHS